ncbi:MAG: adenosylmethionine--8-amino-7-oxononanoate transaminase [Steroidobacter sp.]
MNSAYQSRLIERDLAHVWHPCTQMRDHALDDQAMPMIPIRRGDGVWLEDFNGKRYLDSISSWWTNLFGHSNKRIGSAIKQQVDQLEHVMLAGFTHEPVIRLSEQLVNITPSGLTRCFYAENGSAAIEIAAEMSFHYWQNTGKSGKHRFITLANSYHGETLGALSLSNVELYKNIYQPLLMDVITAPSPDCFNRESGESWEAYSTRMIEPMHRLLQQHAHEVCAVIVEPLVQCAGNMRMYHPVYLSLLRKLCSEYDVHLIADEIAVGFGRTGSLFACEQADIQPDFMCLSKGLTGGFLPLSVVLTTDYIYEAFYAEYTSLRAFLHSHSYTGNPLACAAALATLDIFATEPVIERNRKSSEQLRRHTQPLADHPHVAEVRQHGMICAIELVKNRTTREQYDWRERRGLHIYQHGIQHGILLRPIGNVVYFMPPYVINEDEIDLMVNIAIQGIDKATCE